MQVTIRYCLLIHIYLSIGSLELPSCVIQSDLHSKVCMCVRGIRHTSSDKYMYIQGKSVLCHSLCFFGHADIGVSALIHCALLLISSAEVCNVWKCNVHVVQLPILRS